MKYCPSCQTKYTDDSLLFCLDDGNSLLSYADDGLPEMPTKAFGEMETVVRQNRITSDWGQNQITRPSGFQPEAKKSNTLLTIILTALTIFGFFAGAAGLWLWLNGGGSEISSNTNKSSSPILTNTNASQRKRNDNTNFNADSDDTDWGTINNQASLNGERITYYPGTTAEQCKTDCDKNPKCKAFTLIRAGAYNPNDPPMCYLMSKATEVVSHSCCISAVKKENGVDFRANNLTVEYDTDRPGEDYHVFDLPEDNFELCRSACAADANCKAYTFTKPGFQAANARCWLKTSVPESGKSSCCISGTKQ